MLPHPHLWPALAGAAIGLAAIAWGAIWLARRWPALGARTRWSLFVALGLFEIVYWLNVYAWFVEPNRLVVRRYEIVSEEWRGAPLTLAVLADTHVGGPHVDAARVGRIVARVNALRPDLVVLLGDYAAFHAPEEARSGAERQEILGGVATFATLRAPLGVVAAIGNHDVWYSRLSITRALQDAGIAALWNGNVTIAREDGDFVVAGLADDMTGSPDFAAALDGAPAGLDTLVISHSPDPFADMPHNFATGRAPALMLAAHSHCGQVTIPFLGRPFTPLRHPRYACGEIEEGGRRMIVTAGVGTSILPVRFLNPPEIALVTIR